jgi:hypothetical protein
LPMADYLCHSNFVNPSRVHMHRLYSDVDRVIFRSVVKTSYEN